MRRSRGASATCSPPSRSTPTRRTRADEDRLGARSPSWRPPTRSSAIGETGLDHYRTPEDGWAAAGGVVPAAHRDRQADRRALVIHDRDAHDDVLRVLEAEGAPDRVVFHCFSGDAAFAAPVRRRAATSCRFAGNVTFKNADGLCARPPPSRRWTRCWSRPTRRSSRRCRYRGRPNAPYLVPLTVRALAEPRRRRTRGGRGRGGAAPPPAPSAGEPFPPLLSHESQQKHPICPRDRQAPRVVSRLTAGSGRPRPRPPPANAAGAGSQSRGTPVPGWTDLRRRVRRSPLAIAFFTAILVLFTAAATAFAAMDKTVRLDVDGHAHVGAHVRRHRRRRARARPTCTSAPTTRSRPTRPRPSRDGSRVIVRHGRLLHLTSTRQQRDVWVDRPVGRRGARPARAGRPGRLAVGVPLAAIPRAGPAPSTCGCRSTSSCSSTASARCATPRPPPLRALLRTAARAAAPARPVSVPLGRSTRPTAWSSPSTGSPARLVTNDVAIAFPTRQVRDASLYVGDDQAAASG